MHIRLYYDEYNEQIREWEERYAYWKFVIKKQLKQNVVVDKNENGHKSKPYLDCLVLTEDDWHVHILAHELRHFWQSSHEGKRGKKFGALKVNISKVTLMHMP